MKKLLILAYTPLYVNQNKTQAYCDINANTIVFAKQDNEDLSQAWTQVVYPTNINTFVGWIPTNIIDPYIDDYDRSNILKIDNPTPDINDLQQYLYFNKVLNFNLCGYFCVAYCANLLDSIETWITSLDVKVPTLFDKLFIGNKGRTTGIPDLVNLLHTFDIYANDVFPLLSDVFKIETGKIIFTPYRLQKLLKDNRMIIGCKINYSGVLSGTGTIQHWITLEDSVPDRKNGWIKFYNPASNSIEECSWYELLASTGSIPFGILVKRK